MKKVLITGAGGLLGSSIINKLSDSDNWHIVAASRKHVRYEQFSNVTSVTNEEIFDNSFSLKDIDAVIHCAFSRDNSPAALADCLYFTKRMFDSFKKSGVNNIINVSSQGVYAQTGLYRTLKEDSEIAPKDNYGVVKVATEILMDSVFDDGQNFTNVRLASLNMPQRFTQFFINNALNTNLIKVYGAAQKVSLMDASDAASGLISLIDILPRNWRCVYNLGPGRFTTVGILAQLTARLLHEKYGFPEPSIEFYDKDIVPFTPLNIEALSEDTGWTSTVDDAQMLTNMIDVTLKTTEND